MKNTLRRSLGSLLAAAMGNRRSSYECGPRHLLIVLFWASRLLQWPPSRPELAGIGDITPGGGIPRPVVRRPANFSQSHARRTVTCGITILL